MKKLIVLMLTCMLITTGNQLFSHGVVVSNIALTDQNPTLNYTLVNFDISWNNSWRTALGPSNWDACWIFVKYRKKAELTWNHATLNWTDGSGSGDGHTEPANSNIASSNDNGSGGAHGVFIYHSSDMPQGSVNYTGAKLRWNYGTDGLTDYDSVEVCVFAIEMVYVPQGSFYVGNNGPTTSSGAFFDYPTVTDVYQIATEDAITVGTSDGNLYYYNTSSASGDMAGPIPADYPKGFNGFYCMKYEITQEQYVAFLNKLTRSQQNTRTATSLGAGTTSVSSRYVMKNSSTMSYRNGIRCDATIHTSNPITFYCDFDGDGIANEPNDGQNIASNYMSWADIGAYLDWAALRPMTEFEFEKACRGDQTPVGDEYAWGNTSLTAATGISNGGENNETASNSGANCTQGGAITGPMRVGNFGQGVNTRAAVGATYYGIMEMSGNLGEKVVTVGNATGRAFTGTHGNGTLNSTGDSDASSWPVTDAIGIGTRGGAWGNFPGFLQASSRNLAANTNASRTVDYGGRGVRLAP